MSFQKLAKQFKKVHFIGIGGIGMSAIANILSDIGILVQGSDLNDSKNIENLKKRGIKCFIGHNSANIDQNIDLIVTTSIIKDNNPEIIAAKNNNIKIISRADMLVNIMSMKRGITVAGTHGKTSTTAMIAVLLEEAQKDPMVINGGVINYYNSNAKMGNGDYVVAESDESDASFVKLPSFIGVINNIEAEHLDFYGGDFSLVKKYYMQYAAQIPQDGLLALGTDDIEVKNIYNQIKDQDNITTFGLDENSDIFAKNISFSPLGAKFDAVIKKKNLIIKELSLPLYGYHNILNSLSAIAIANYFNFSENLIRQAFSKFAGVKKRFTKTGEVNGVTIIDDYAHHPTEIKTTLRAARDLVKNNKVITVFQPHKHSRVKDLFNEFCHSFNDADIVIVADIFKVGQEIKNINQEVIIDGIINSGHKNVIKLNNKKDLANIIKASSNKGDVVVCVGAGSISGWANELPDKLKNL
ncbi:UDP-N-acetylmuramate--L-alanine ligase [Rickettsiales bacterium]|nr:UDP-N-acetylmuramate--L-alanine ligase [Rickettsiales bacterium]